MPAVKVFDRNSKSPRRRPHLWETFGVVGVNPTEIKEGRGVYYAIIKQEQIEKLITPDARDTFTQNGFDITTPIEYDTLRSVIIRHLDKVISEYNDEEVTQSIERSNDWAKVEQVVRIPTTGRLLKIKFQSTNMAQQALRDGIIVLNQKINPKHVEKEQFVRITPCYNCFSYRHKTRECPLEKKNLCSNCGEEGHRHTECHSTEPKCINCGGKHRTLAAACQIRKDFIKEKGRELRLRSRSRSQTRQHTYAEAISSNTVTNQQFTTVPHPQNIDETKTIITKIMTAIAYAHYMESIRPGTFQENINEMFRLNKLPLVKFPSNIFSEGIKELYKETLETQFNASTNQSQQQSHETEQDKETETQFDEENMEIDSNKRQRESIEPPSLGNKEKNKKKEMNNQKKYGNTQTSLCSMHSHHQFRRVSTLSHALVLPHRPPNQWGRVRREAWASQLDPKRI